LLRGPNAPRFAAALLCATVATYSFANGMLAWPLGFGALMLAPRRAPAYQLFLWPFAGTVAIGLYFTGYSAPSYHPAPGAALLNPELFFKYVTIYLGQPIAGFSLGGAGVAGLLGVLVWLWAAMFWRAQVPRPAYALGLLWPAYSIANALLTAYARAPLGVEQALSPRYATLAIPFWAGLLVFCIYARAAETRNHLLRMLCFLIALSSLHGAYRWTERYHVYERAKNDLIADDAQADLHWLYPDTNVLRERSAWLRAHGLSVFRAHDR
jgi:hypothetical protein